jgi:Na+/H+ antiporter NhaD/arsenite permease-like protein
MLISIFALVYLGMLVGGIPGSKVDRTGVALLGAILMMVVGEVTPERAVEYLDVPTLALLFSMMVLSAQLRLGGFYAAVVRRFGMAEHSPRALLAIVILVAAVLAAVFTNDVVALAIAPVLLAICRVRGLRPLPFLLALACATNVGSAATLIGNPQNILIGQALRLHFARYALIALLPTVLGLAVIWGVIYLLDRDALQVPGGTLGAAPPTPVETAGPTFDAWQAGKGLVLAGTLLVVFFFTPLPRHVVALAAAAVVLLSKQFHTREMLGLVDWELLVLFGGLFVVNGAFLDSGLMADAERWLAAQGMDARNPAVLFLIAPLLSITVSNVPAVMLLLPLAVHPIAGPALALSSTLAGNALIVGSIANIIVVEQAARGGVAISWRDHARVGLPVTVLTLVVAGGVLLLFR